MHFHNLSFNFWSYIEHHEFAKKSNFSYFEVNNFDWNIFVINLRFLHGVGFDGVMFFEFGQILQRGELKLFKIVHIYEVV